MSTITATAGSGTTTEGRARVHFGHAAVNTPDLDRFRRFYEDVLGLRLAVTEHPDGAPFRRMGVFTDRLGQSAVLLVFEVPGYDSGLPEAETGRRGRIDHLAFEAADDAGFAEITTRLVEAGASSGEVSVLGPVRSVVFVDPDGGHRNLQVTVPGWRPAPDADVPDPDLLAALLTAR